VLLLVQSTHVFAHHVELLCSGAADEAISRNDRDSNYASAVQGDHPEHDVTTEHNWPRLRFAPNAVSAMIAASDADSAITSANLTVRSPWCVVSVPRAAPSDGGRSLPLLI
jgi:hypothetical protein